MFYTIVVLRRIVLVKLMALIGIIRILILGVLQMEMIQWHAHRVMPSRPTMILDYAGIRKAMVDFDVVQQLIWTRVYPGRKLFINQIE